MNSISHRINCSDWFSAPKHQKRHKVAQVKTGQIRWPGFASLSFRSKRNSCARSLRGQYARMGPLQYLFLCGLLYTKTDGKFTKKKTKRNVCDGLISLSKSCERTRVHPGKQVLDELMKDVLGSANGSGRHWLLGYS